MREVMVDLETLGTRVGAPVVAIGAVDSDGREFYAQATLVSQDKMDPPDLDTLRWWFEQSPDAVARTFHGATRELKQVLRDFATWLAGSERRLWGNSAAFDLGLLGEAYRRHGFKPPWSHRDEACYRTLKSLRRDVMPPSFEGLPHYALDDARHQMRHLAALLSAVVPETRPDWSPVSPC